MDTLLTREFIRRVPKTDLHLHLDGSLRLSTLIELAKSDNVELPSYTVVGMNDLVFKEQYNDLGEYLQGFAYTCAVLQNAENLERVAFELAEDCIAEGVRYIEVRFAPQLLVSKNLSIKESVQAVAAGLKKAASAHNSSSDVMSGDDLEFNFGIIVCAMRRFNKYMGTYYSNLLAILEETPEKEIFSVASLEMARVAVALRDNEGLPIVGFDLAGEESGFPASYHSDAYQYAHSHFMAKTVHAGEAYGPESIFQAITECYANRIGHGTFLFSEEAIRDDAIKDRAGYVNQLVEYVAGQRITMEVCLTSNKQTIPSLKSLSTHPISKMLERNLAVSICTDNRLVSHTSVTDEYQIAIKELAITPRQLRNIIIAGFKGAFYGSYNHKRDCVRKVIAQYDKLAKEFGINV